MADFLDDRLKSLGFATRREKSVAAPGMLPSNGADIVIGTLQGTGKGKIMMQAHMDTVYEKGILQTQPFRIDGNRVYGPGIADDKGGISVILHALKILKEAGWKDFHTLTVLFNPDEEIGSRGSGELISSLADQHQTVLSFEPTGAKAVSKTEALLLGAAGGSRVRLEVKGVAAHAGVAPELGRNAVIELAHQMLQTKDLAKDIPGVTLHWTNIKADQALNQIPNLAVAIGDSRITIPGAEVKLNEALQAKIKSSKLIPDTTTTVTLVVGRPAFLAGPKGLALAQRAQAIYKEIDRDLNLVPMTGGGASPLFGNPPTDGTWKGIVSNYLPSSPPLICWSGNRKIAPCNPTKEYNLDSCSESKTAKELHLKSESLRGEQHRGRLGFDVGYKAGGACRGVRSS
jgi:glutamate carboxypeptidase